LLREGVYWSSCPDSELLQNLARRGLSLVVDLTEEGECTYELPPGVERLRYPVPDFSFAAHEGVYLRVLKPLVKAVSEGRVALVHCRGGIGRSGAVSAMLLVLLDRMPLESAIRAVKAKDGGEWMPAQELAVRWFERVVSTLGVGLLEELLSFLERQRGCSRALEDVGFLNHLSTVANISLDILEALQPVYGFEEKHFASAYAAGLLHDLGRLVSGDEHHVVSAQIAGMLESQRVDRGLVVKAVYHHRRKTDLLGDAELAAMGKRGQVVAAAVRAADAFKDAYWGTGCYKGITRRGDALVVELPAESSGCYLDEDKLREKFRPLRELTGLGLELDYV
jgi:HD superfamily phosphodiesterase